MNLILTLSFLTTVTPVMANDVELAARAKANPPPSTALSAEESLFFQSHNVKLFLRHHPKRKLLLQKTLTHLRGINPEDRAFLLKNLRQVDQMHFRSYIQELRKAECQCGY